MGANKIKTSIGLDRDLITRLDRIAKVGGTNRSSLITDLVYAGLEQQELMIKATADPVLIRAIGKVITDPGVLRSMVAGMRSELTDDQMALFNQSVRDWELGSSNLKLPAVVEVPRIRRKKAKK